MAGGCGSGFTQHTPSELALGAPNFSYGPTGVIPLLAGSAAIDAGDPVTCANPPVSNQDQRSQRRFPTCDIGAFEYPPLTVYLPLITH